MDVKGSVLYGDYLIVLASIFCKEQPTLNKHKIIRRC